MKKTTPLMLALATTALLMTAGCEDNQSTTEAPATTQEPPTGLPKLKTPVVEEPTGTPPAEPVAAGEPAPTKPVAAEPAAAEPDSPSATSEEASASTPPAATPAADAATESAQQTAAAEASAETEWSMTQVLIDEAMRAGWSTYEDENGDLYVVPPGVTPPDLK